MKQTPEQLTEPIRLTVSLIESGKFIRAGEQTPYLCVEDVPEHLRQYLVIGNEGPFFTPAERDFYNNPQPEPELIYQPLSGERGLRRQAAQAASILQEEIYAEEQVEAANKLSPELEEVLQNSHDQHVALTKARLEANQRFTDAAYESATQEAESRTVVFHVKRGAIYARCEKTKLRAGENVFTKEESGEWVFAGVVDSNGEPPPQPIIP